MATMQEQFESIKKQYPDAMLLFRCGDFYEIYNEDAEAASEILHITLTKRGNGTQMCGFPHHALDSYLPRLVRAGKRVAICDQLEDPEKNAPAEKQDTTEHAQTQVNDWSEKMQDEPEFIKRMRENTRHLQLSLFDPKPSDDIIHFRDKVAADILVAHFRSCTEEEAVQAANTLVYRLYGYRLSIYTEQP